MLNFERKMLVKELSFYIGICVNNSKYFEYYIKSCAIKSNILNCLSIHHLDSKNETIQKIQKMAKVYKENTKMENSAIEELRTIFGSEWKNMEETAKRNLQKLENLEMEYNI